MEVVKKSKDYTIYQKRSKRYAVRDASLGWVRGDEKVKILLSEKLITAPVPKPKEEAPAEPEAEATEESEEVAEAESE